MPKKPFHVFSLILISSAALSAQAMLNSVPSREIGHAILPKPDPFAVTTTSPNLVEGREFFQPTSVALDTDASPPILYVADSGNNRILAWKNATSFANGKPADLVIGQKDFYSTGANGPGVTAFTTGLYLQALPASVAVWKGDLYVSDSGNNRVLRFRAPFSAPAGQQIPDLCLGQPSFGSRAANSPNGQISEKGLNTPGAIRFDKTGNLWVADFGNNRVLEYLAADIAKPATPFSVVAKTEIGQPTFSSKPAPLPATDDGRKISDQLAAPGAINFDSAGRLYIADADSNWSRVLVFVPPFPPTGATATRIMGIYPIPLQGQPPIADPVRFAIQMSQPSDIFFLPGTQGMGVVDSGFHRILLFDSIDKWPDAATAFSPSAKQVIGHVSGVSGINSKDQKSLVANDGNGQGTMSSASTFFSPLASVFFNNELFVADTGNNRVVVMPYQNGTFQAAYRLLGQDRYDSNSINLIEGREFDFLGTVAGQASADAAIAIDSTGDTPHLYVSDPYNNRVLGFKDIRKLAAGSPADIVIGQPDFATAVCNYHPNDPVSSGDPASPTQSSLCRPLGLVVDSSGNLYVADSRNNRVLRFPAPFSHPGNQVADLVLGQPSFFIKLTDPSASTMGLPYGLAFAGNKGLLVSDQLYNRVVYIPFTNGGFTSADNGKAATKVFGQSDFTSVAPGATERTMNSPRHIATDTDNHPYVVDGGNGRILIFPSLVDNADCHANPSCFPATGQSATIILSGQSNTITSIFVNQLTGEAWAGDLGNNKIINYPKYDTLQFNPAPTSTVLTSFGPVALAQDQYGDLIVAERINRVTFYFPGLTSVNAANFVLGRGLAPNVWSTLTPAAGATFGKDTADLNSLPNPLPLPKSLADVQVLFDGTPCPLSYVSPSQINFLVPWNAQTGGNSSLLVQKISTGQVFAAGLVTMNAISPGIFTGAKVGANAVQAAVINQDGSINGPSKPAARGDIISIYATGQGFIDGAPPDGVVPQGNLVTPYTPRVWIGTCFVDTCPLQTNEKVIGGNYVQYSGTSFPGLWQVNVQIPQATDPNQPAAVFLSVNGLPSNGISVNGAAAVIYVE